MTMNVDKLAIPREYDRRIKLTEADKVEIRELYKLSEWSTRKLAAKYDVDRRLIQFVLDPAKLARSNELHAQRRLDKRYYDKDAWRETMAEHRAYKKTLRAMGVLEAKPAQELPDQR